ncbi:protein phosphatase 1 regulatory subunit 14D isoform X2 [Bos indicus x Bos taurus]|uniref:protein phosphatase 1 regulatory subunit 14D isoform X2 n=1 Tax=Bos indicus x Bos taurus TaxID=30522 RepID=UPI000F7D1EA2|nr:protein phosphatase 1 regulatory subunit 14D isoform X2 [Bos indicus x Bos taurus]
MGGPRSTNIPGVKKGRRARCSHAHFGDPAAGRTAKELTYPDTRTGAEQRARHAPNPLRLLLALLGPGYLRRINQLLQSLRSTWRLSWNYPQRSRRLSWRLFSKTAPAPQSLLSLSCSVNSRNFGDSVDLRNKPCETSFISLSTAQSALNPWIFSWVGNHSLGPRQGTWRMRRDI